MCFEVLAFVPPANSSKSGATADDANDDELSLMDLDGNDIKPSTNFAELGALNESLQELLDGIQVTFFQSDFLSMLMDNVSYRKSHLGFLYLGWEMVSREGSFP
ncbi:exocyst complex component SEC3A-like [Magnolia sinica]|uniref:exocyst complex component SEC3A-like n=1 Tax=Magnolia sinica TaxID=86752 RepID=UPI00265A6DCC|nr:exocyst complex component SEC3A-like [Magnolia sinica]